MLSTFLELKKVLIYISKNSMNLEYKKIFISTDEWAELEDLKAIFEVFLNPSVKLQGQKYTTLSQALLYIYIIYSKLEELLEEYTLKIEKVSFILYFLLILY